jgi:hypothetical protein
MAYPLWHMHLISWLTETYIVECQKKLLAKP